MIIFKRCFHAFATNKLLGKYLIYTNTITCGGLMGLGDVIQQEIELHKKIHRDGVFNWTRTAHMTIIGLAIGPIQHWIYKYMDIFLPQRTHSSIIKKIMFDQFVVSPGCIYIFIYGIGLLETGGLDAGHKEIKEKFFTIYLADWLVWPPTQYINFAYIPTKYRVLYINVLTMLYDVFLSYIKYKKEAGT